MCFDKSMMTVGIIVNITSYTSIVPVPLKSSYTSLPIAIILIPNKAIKGLVKATKGAPINVP